MEQQFIRQTMNPSMNVINTNENNVSNNNNINNDNHKTVNEKNNRKLHCRQYLIMSSAMRAYIESLPEKLTIMEELTQYQYWKSLRTEFIATFLYVLFTCGSLVLSHYQHPWNYNNHNNDDNIGSSLYNDDKMNDSIYSVDNNNSDSEQSQLKNAIGTGLTVATLVQCTGHVCGCHLTIAITIGLYVSGRVTPLRILSYLLIQFLSSLVGAIVVQNLFCHLIPVLPKQNLQPSQVFGFEFLATLIIVLTYLANCDQNRRDLGFKSLSIGLAYTVAHLFSFIATGASLNPAKTLAISILTGKFCLHWIYWVAPLIAGLFGGLLYEYIGTIKPPQPKTDCGCGCECCCRIMNRESSSSSSSELRHQFNSKPNNNKKLPTTTTNDGEIIAVTSNGTDILHSQVIHIGAITPESALLDDETELFSIGPDINLNICDQKTKKQELKLTRY